MSFLSRLEGNHVKVFDRSNRYIFNVAKLGYYQNIIDFYRCFCTIFFNSKMFILGFTIHWENARDLQYAIQVSFPTDSTCTIFFTLNTVHTTVDLPDQCSWSSQLGRPQTHTWHRTAWWNLVPSLGKLEWTGRKLKWKKKRSDNQVQLEQLSGGSGSSDTLSRSVVNLDVGLSKFGTLTWHHCLWGRRTARQRAQGEAVVSCLSAGRGGRGQSSDITACV